MSYSTSLASVVTGQCAISSILEQSIELYLHTLLVYVYTPSTEIHAAIKIYQGMKDNNYTIGNGACGKLMKGTVAFPSMANKVKDKSCSTRILWTLEYELPDK